MFVDRDRKRLYGEGVRIDVSNPRAMRPTVLPESGPIAVDPTTGRYATTGSPGLGDGIRTLSVRNPDDTLHDSQPLSGNVLAMDVDPGNGIFFVTTRDEDQLVVYSARSREVLAVRPIEALAMNPVFSPASSEVFVNRAVGSYADYQWLTFDRTYQSGNSSEGHILAVDGPHDLIYLTHQSKLEVRERANWKLAGTQYDTDAYAVFPDPRLNRVYIRRLHDLAAFDSMSGAYLETVRLVDGLLISTIAFAPGDDRIYVLGFEMPPGQPLQTVLLVVATSDR